MMIPKTRLNNNKILHLKFSPSLNLNKIEHFSKVSVNDICSKIPQFHALRLAAAANSTLAEFR